jgi:hypothetical protein
VGVERGGDGMDVAGVHAAQRGGEILQVHAAYSQHTSPRKQGISTHSISAA